MEITPKTLAAWGYGFTTMAIIVGVMATLRPVLTPQAKAAAVSYQVRTNTLTLYTAGYTAVVVVSAVDPREGKATEKAADQVNQDWSRICQKSGNCYTTLAAAFGANPEAGCFEGAARPKNMEPEPCAIHRRGGGSAIYLRVKPNARGYASVSIPEIYSADLIAPVGGTVWTVDFRKSSAGPRAPILSALHLSGSLAPVPRVAVDLARQPFVGVVERWEGVSCG